jgi:hypothetical protein
MPTFSLVPTSLNPILAEWSFTLAAFSGNIPDCMSQMFEFSERSIMSTRSALPRPKRGEESNRKKKRVRVRDRQRERD